MPFEEAPPDSFLSLFSAIHHYLHSFLSLFFFSPCLLLPLRRLESGFGLGVDASFCFSVLLDFLVLGQKPGCLTAAPLCLRLCQVSPDALIKSLVVY